MKPTLTGAAIAISLGLGAISAGGAAAPSRSSAARATTPKKVVRRPAAKPTRPYQGYRCPGPSAADGKSAPPGAAVVQRFKLTRTKRPTPTSAVLRADATVTAPTGAELEYLYTTTGGRVAGDGPSTTWTLEGAGTWTISLEVYNRTSGCTTFTSATYTIAEPRRKRSRT